MHKLSERRLITDVIFSLLFVDLKMKTILRYTFKKYERLCSSKLLGELSEKGHSFFVHPFKVVWMPACVPGTPADREVLDIGTNNPVQVAFAVSKRKTGSAVLRNTIRRRMREAWRKNKHLLYETLEKKGKQIAVMLIYTPDTESDYALIEGKIIVSLHRLNECIKE